MLSTRRSLLTAFLALPIIEGQRLQVLAQDAPRLAHTLACDDDAETTLERESGPFSGQTRHSSAISIPLRLAANASPWQVLSLMIAVGLCREALSRSGMQTRTGAMTALVSVCVAISSPTGWGGGGSTPSFRRSTPVEHVTFISRYSDRGGRF